MSDDVIDVGQLTPHMWWPLIEMLAGSAVGPKFCVMGSGRATVKSTTNAEIMILEAIMKGNVDMLVWTYEEKSVSVTIARNLEEAINYLHLDQALFKFNIPINSRKWVDITYAGRSSRIGFIHASGQKSLNAKGMEPVKGHRGLIQLFYEADQFIGWDASEIGNAVMTLTRGKNVHPDFRSVIECNEPRPGSGGMGLHDFVEIKQREHQIMKILSEKYPDVEEYQRPVLGLCKTNLLEMGPAEYRKFTSPQQRSDLIGTAISDPDTFDGVYRGKPISANGAVFKQLREEDHFGQHADFFPDYLGIGVDLGSNDATCCVLSGIQVPNEKLHRHFKYQAGMEVAGHSNRGHEWIMPKTSDKYGQAQDQMYQWMDIATSINRVVIPFIDHCARKYTKKIIIVNIEYADRESFKFISGVARVFVHNPLIKIQLTGAKERNSNSTAAFSGMMNVPHVFKIANRHLGKSLTALTYLDRPEHADEELKIKDLTSSRECKYFDLGDALKYTGDRGKYSDITALITRAVFDKNPNLINKNFQTML